jgi:hypothetical protein
MHLKQDLESVGALAPESIDRFREHIPTEWIEESLYATGMATVRHRRLPADQVVWLVIGMALFRNRSIVEVVDKLNLALPRPSQPRLPVAVSAVPQARGRVGADPMAWLFTRCADEWGHASAAAHRWRGLSLYGVDGSTLRVADTPENGEFFGYPNGGHRGPGGYPVLRMVGLMALRSHLLASVAFGPYETGEHGYAAELWASVPDDSLTIVDKGFLAAGVLYPLAQGGRNRHWLTRAKVNTKWCIIKRLGPGDLLVQMDVSSHARTQNPSLPKTWQARAITYQRKGFRRQTLLTSTLDPELYPADEVAALYHERWELELGYDEIKTEMLDREETLRSKSPVAVAQELWGILIAYNLVRLEMERLAAQAHVEPTRISFVGALHMIVDEFGWLAVTSPGAIPNRLRDLGTRMKRLLLPPRRSERRYPRAVKVKMSNYPRKRRSPTRGAAK